MKNRVKTIEVTKAYCQAFNARDLAVIEEMLDPQEAIFSRQGQPTIIGATQIINRTKNLFHRLDDHAHKLHMVNAIIDLKDSKARPCLLGILDGERYSVVVISVKPNGKILSIAILFGEHNTSIARAIEPMEEEETKKEYHEEHKHRITQKELDERKERLQIKAHELEMRLQEEGATPLLMERFKRLQQAEAKLNALIELRAQQQKDDPER